MYSGNKYLVQNAIEYRSNNSKLSGGFPHSEIHGSKLILSSSWLIAEYHVFHRLLLPRHSPNALLALDLIQKETGVFAAPKPCGKQGGSPSRRAGSFGAALSDQKHTFPALHLGTRASDVGRTRAEDEEHVPDRSGTG